MADQRRHASRSWWGLGGQALEGTQISDTVVGRME